MFKTVVHPTVEELHEPHYLVFINPSCPSFMTFSSFNGPPSTNAICFFCTALAYIAQPARSHAPSTLRIVLLGPTGSGKAVQAALIASKYNIINSK